MVLNYRRNYQDGIDKPPLRSSPAYGHFTTGGGDERINSTLPPMLGFWITAVAMAPVALADTMGRRR